MNNVAKINTEVVPQSKAITPMDMLQMAVSQGAATVQDVGKVYLKAIDNASELKDQGAMDRLNNAKRAALSKIKGTK